MNPIQRTKDWIKDFVIQHELCPFAAHPFQHDRIRYCLVETTAVENLAKALIKELNFLSQAPATEVETSLIIHPNVLTDFLAYNDFLAVADSILSEMQLEGHIQIASFHPEYQFADALADAAINFVTRSPFPMLHLLREESVTKAIVSHEDIDQIPLDNMKKMEELGLEKLRAFKRS